MEDHDLGGLIVLGRDHNLLISMQFFFLFLHIGERERDRERGYV